MNDSEGGKHYIQVMGKLLEVPARRLTFTCPECGRELVVRRTVESGRDRQVTGKPRCKVCGFDLPEKEGE